MNVFMIAPLALSGHQKAGGERRCLTSAASEQVPAVVAAAFLPVAVARLAAVAAVVAVVERPTCTPVASPD